ncbi:hypothetical protein D2Q93_15205 [Alicyclobacillaceae bacterium I2511]|nr:hypothetical protein D2Q93_15205 [Alicyclobacillaceae bacterium I2511]
MRRRPFKLDLRRLSHALFLGITLSFLFFLSALWLGREQEGFALTLSLIGISLVLEAQPAAVASIPLGFAPLTGAAISILANLIPIPLLMLTFDQVIRNWSWMRHRLQRADKWSAKYGHYGVWGLSVLSPFLGAYVCVVVGFGLRWHAARIFASVTLGTIVSTLLITYGGHWFVHLIHLGPFHI